jgi:galactonate dehydratase
VKITDVRPWIVTGPPTEAAAGPAAHLQQYVFVQVDTDEGLTGWGEVTTYPGLVANRAVAAMVREVRPVLVGEDPSRIEAIWHKLFRLFTYMGTRGATTAMISGIDIALWDLRGQALGLPIYELLGGGVRETVPLYVHFAPDTTPEGMAANAKEQVDLGSSC